MGQLVTPEQTKTRIFKETSYTSDGSGAINSVGIIRQVSQFGPPGIANTWTFSLQAPSAPIAAIFTVYINGLPWTTWFGSSPSGPIQLWNMEHAEIVASGLTANTVYQVNLSGFHEQQHHADALFPSSGTTAVAGIVNVAGTVNVQSNIRTLAQDQTLAGGSGSFTLTGLTAADQYLVFMPNEVGVNVQPVALTVSGVADTSITYGSVVIAGHQWDWVPIVPIFENQVTVSFTTLGSQTNPVGLKIYATPNLPGTPKKIRRAKVVAFGASGTTAIFNLTDVIRVKSVEISGAITPTVNGPQLVTVEATNAYTGLSETISAMNTETVGTTQGPYFNVNKETDDYVCAGIPAANALQIHAFQTFSNGQVTVIYEDIRNI